MNVAKTASEPSSKPTATASQLGSIVKSIRDIMRKDKGLNGDLDRLPQLIWLIFLKFLDDMDKVRETEIVVSGKLYTPILEPPYRWRDWASTNDGLTGDELVSFVNNDEAIRPDGSRGLGLLAYIRSLRGVAGPDSREVVATVFQSMQNRMLSGYLLRDVVNKVAEIDLSSTEETHTLSLIYESLLKELRDAAGDSGEFYTPRPVVRFIVQMIDPKLGETILDPGAGTGGFLVESFSYLEKQCKTTRHYEKLQRGTLSGIEAKSIPYLLCQMNLLLHGLEAPNIDPLNALRFPLREIGDKDRVDIVVTNPPFGGEEERGILSNFPNDKQTIESCLLFLQLIMRKLRRPIEEKRGGRCGMIVPDGTLNGIGVPARIRKELLQEFNLHTIVKLPKGVFAPYSSIQTNLLFYERNGPTKDIWYYELPLPEGRKNYTKTKPLQYEEFIPIIQWWNNREESEFSWRANASDILSAEECSLDIKNPTSQKEIVYEDPVEILDDILEKEEHITKLMKDMKNILNPTERVTNES